MSTPAVVAAVSTGPSPLWFATRGAGVMTLVCLTVVVVLGIMTSVRVEGRRTPRFVSASLHRNFALFTILLLAVHIATSVIDPFAGIRPVDAAVPFVGTYRTVWLGLGAIAADVLLAVTVTSLLRKRLGPRVWKLIHWGAYASWPVAVVHGLGTGSDSQAPWMLGITAACLAAVLVTLARRLLVGRFRTVPLRLACAGMAVAAVYTICAWAVGGPLQPGWAQLAGTPAPILKSSPTPSAHSEQHGFSDPMIGVLTGHASNVDIALRDSVDTALTVVIVPPGPSDTLPLLTVDRGGRPVCTSVPARVGVSIYAVCAKTRLVITLYGTGSSITARIVTSGPL
ncbi:MAG: ferric reductase-like transmembrane domain-containing protein [Candidatus Dormiibacterota bacterium]